VGGRAAGGRGRPARNRSRARFLMRAGRPSLPQTSLTHTFQASYRRFRRRPNRSASKVTDMAGGVGGGGEERARAVRCWVGARPRLKRVHFFLLLSFFSFVGGARASRSPRTHAREADDPLERDASPSLNPPRHGPDRVAAGDIARKEARPPHPSLQPGRLLGSCRWCSPCFHRPHGHPFNLQAGHLHLPALCLRCHRRGRGGGRDTCLGGLPPVHRPAPTPDRDRPRL